MNSPRERFGWNKAIGWLVFTAGLVLFGLTRARGVAPVVSAPYLSRGMGLDPFPLMLHPVWAACMRGIARWVPPDHAVAAANLLHVIWAALSLTLLYSLTRRWPFTGLPERYGRPATRRLAGVVSGLVAATVLAGAIPFWMTATRAHPAALDTVWLLLCAWLLQSLVERPRRGVLVLVAFLWGAGAVQSVTLLALAPAGLLLGLWVMLRGGFLRPRMLLACAGAALAGLSLYVLQALWYMRQPAFHWREFTGFMQVLVELWKAQAVTLRGAVIPVGWILIVAGALLPWVFLYVIPLGSMRQGRIQQGSYVLFGTLTLIAGALCFNTPVAPWRLTGTNPLLVLPYVFLAAWTGRLAGLWFLLARGPTRSSASNRPAGGWLALRAGIILLASGVAVLAAILNFPVVDARPGDVVHRFAGESVRSLQGRTWLVSEGVLDDLLRVAAFEQGSRVRILNLRLTQYRPYLRYLAAQLEDTRMQFLVRIGLAALIREWYQHDPEVTERVAVLSTPDDIVAGGHVPLPQRTLFLVVGEEALPDAGEWFRSHQEFWDRFLPEAKPPAASNPAYSWLLWVRMRASRVANNLGVLMEDWGHPEWAHASYQYARRLDADNFSALLNLLDLAARTRDERETAWRAEVEELLARRGRKLPLWSLSAHYGYIRRPEAYAGRGWVWALSGKPNVAIQEIRRAIELAGPQASWQSSLGALYFREGEDEKSAEAYLAALRQEPDHRASLLGLARLDMRRGSFESARGYLERLAELGHHPLDLAMEEAALESLAGRSERVRSILLDVVEEDPGQWRAWVALAVLAMEEDDPVLAERALRRFEPARRVYPGLGVTLAGLEIRRGELERARMFLEQALRVAQDRPAALEQMLRLNVFERRRDLAERHAGMLLTIDPGHAYANHIMGTIQYSQGQWALAEQSFRAALRRRREPDVLNDSAWLLYRRNRPEEALPLAREAVALHPDRAIFQHTLGVILMALDRPDEAAAALQTALAALPDHPALLYHMALLLERQGFPDEAGRLVRPLLDRVSEMGPDTYEGVRSLMARLRESDP